LTEARDEIIKGDGAVAALMEDGIGQRKAAPLAVFPGKARIDEAGRPPGASGLVLRGGVGPFDQAIEAVEIEGAWLNAIEDPVVITGCPSVQPDQAAAGSEDSQFDRCDIGSPNEKGA
jgi:hypothetical protein